MTFTAEETKRVIDEVLNSLSDKGGYKKGSANIFRKEVLGLDPLYFQETLAGEFVAEHVAAVVVEGHGVSGVMAMGLGMLEAGIRIGLKLAESKQGQVQQTAVAA